MIEFKKNQELLVDIISEGYQGEGIAKLQGFPIFTRSPWGKVKSKLLSFKESWF